MSSLPTSDPPAANQPRLTMTRRQFLTSTGASLVVGGVAGSLLTRFLPGGQAQTLATYPKIQIAHLSDLQVGKPIAFDYPLKGQSSYLIQLGTPALDGIGPHGDIVAFSTICVHMGCALAGRYKNEQKVLGPCPCHLSTYDLALAGKPTIGVATENLPQIELTLDSEGMIVAEGVWGLIYGFESNLMPGNVRTS